jgi:hypothetical protein
MVSSYRLLEKKALFEAVIGVVGVLGSCREGGGLKSRPAGRAGGGIGGAFIELGKLIGAKFIGGRLRGCKLFLLA